MDESEENMSAEDIQGVDSPISVKTKPKKRSLVERELETNLTARVTSPVTSEGTSTSRYGRARKLKTGLDIDLEKLMKPLKVDVSKTQPQAYKMHASNSPIRKESPKRAVSVSSSIEDQIENIYNENISLSRFGSEEKAKSQSPAKKYSKIYMRKDLIQKPDTDTVVLIKNMFSPSKPNTHLNNILERSSEKYNLNGHGKAWNGFTDTSSVVKTLDFDGKKKKNEDDYKLKRTLSKNELFELEASCEYQVGDLAWARVGTYPFWPCIITREPFSDMFVKKKLFGRVERAVIHVTFFGDNGRRGWIVDNMLREYRGRAEFESAREKFTPEAKKKDPRLYAAHFVSEKKLPLWNLSVEEAETLMKEPKRLRIDIFYDMLEKSRAVKSTPKREKGGKITRTDSDVSLSESLYDTLFSEDDGKTDDSGHTKGARKKSLDVSEVVTACLDNMAAKSGIIQIQRQSHMDRWLQKAKSKTPEKMQPKLQINVKKEKRKDRVKKESRKLRKLRKNESLSSDANLMPYQNEHDYSSVNYENHNINDSSNASNKNTDSASGHDSTLDTSGIGIIVKVESLSSMEDYSQDDIITTVVNDDILMTEPEHIKDVNGHDESKNTDNTNDRIENNNEYNLETSKVVENREIDLTLEIPLDKSNLNNSTQPRRSKRKRQTLEGLNNSNTENKVKEPKLDLDEERANNGSTLNSRLTYNETENSSEDKKTEDTKTKLEHKEPTITKLVKEASSQSKFKSKEFIGFNSNCKPIVVIEPLKLDGLVLKAKVKKQPIQDKSLDSVIIHNAKDNIGSLLMLSDVVKGTDNKTAIEELRQNSTDDSGKSEETKPDAALNPSTSCIDGGPDPDRDTVSKTDHLQVTECSTISEIMEVDNSKEKLTSLVIEEEKCSNLSSGSIITTADNDSTVPLETEGVNKAVNVKLTSVQQNKEFLNDNKVPIVVIGEETYVFDRTLSQDYDEVYANRCDQVNNFPVSPINQEVDETGALENNVTIEEISQDKICDMDKTELSSSSKDENLSSEDDCGSLNKPNDSINISNTSDSFRVSPSEQESEVLNSDNSKVSKETPENDDNLDRSVDCEDGNVDNGTKLVLEEKSSSLNNATSNTAKLEQKPECNLVTEEKNTQGIFLDKGVELASAQFSNKDKKIKPLRFSLKRTRNNSSNTDKNSSNIDKKCDEILKSTTESLESKLQEVTSNIKETDQKSVTDTSDDTKGQAKENSDNSKFKDRPDVKIKLKRTRSNSSNIDKICDNIQKSNTPEKILEEVTHDFMQTDLESTAVFDDTKGKAKQTNPDKVQSKGRPDVKMNDPEFLKYLEIRQDALIDEHPDLNEDEIVTYLYQNWLYEEENKSEIKKTDDAEQYAVKGLNQEPAPKVQKIKLIRKKPKAEKPKLKNEDIRNMMPKRNVDFVKESPVSIDDQDKVRSENIGKRTHESKDNVQSIDIYKSVDMKSINMPLADSAESKSPEDDTIIEQLNVSGFEMDLLPKVDGSSKDVNTLSDVNTNAAVSFTNETNDLDMCNAQNLETNISKNSMCPNKPVSYMEGNDLSKPVDDKYSLESENLEVHTDDLDIDTQESDLDIKTMKDSKECAPSKINGIISNEICLESEIKEEFDAETASINSEDSGVSLIKRKVRSKENKNVKRAMDDPEFVKYLEARQDALIEEQPDLTQEEIVTYLYQTWFYEESTKSDLKKTDETEQSNLVKGLNQEPAPQPRKYKKKPKVEKDPDLKNLDIRSMMQKEKPKRKATQSKPYYNEDDSDLEEEDLETFKIFDRDEQMEGGEEIDEVELYFEQLTKPKPNVFKGFVRERVCEICDKTGNLVKCKSCHGTYHVDCVKKEAEVIEVAAPTRGRKKKRGRKPKGYDPSLDFGSQSDERSQDANNSEEMNMSVEDDESHLVVDADNFESQWEVKLKELQTENQEDYVSDQEMNWEVEPGQCEIVDIKQKEKPIDYSDYKCIKCLKYDTPVCFVCKLNKSPKSQTEIRQKCQVAHCHRYYHLECLEYWPQTQFHSWEPSKNKKEIEYIEALTCPRHVCHTCVSDDPRGCKTRFSGDKLARCVKCPATYHAFTKCLPAGSQILTGSQIICPRHYEHRPGKVPCHVNTGWCFICALGGTLICCEYCPTSFHAECLNIKPPEGSYMCEDCETGRLPLYGEMVWVKLGHYRWWPGIVLHPTEIPDNIMAVKHSPGEFVVRFFGQYDHYWVNRGRVFPFQEGDSGKISSQKSKIDAAFTTAMEHAQRACEILKKMEPNEEEDLDIASSLLPPHYVKLKTNKPVGNVARRDVDANSLTQCDCDPMQPDPCGPYSHCLNRMLLTECGPMCRAGDRCNNRAFERRLYPRLEAYRTPMRGWGLRTMVDIKQGQFVIEYVGELIDMEEFRRRMCRKHEIRDENFYFLTLDKERMIDAGPKGNLARFMNHCCEPNCETQKWTVLGDVRVGLFALRDIPANSEVTFNYNLECAGIEKKRCLCGAKRCSGYIGAKPKQLQDDQPKKAKPPAKRTYKKRKPVEDPSTSKKVPKIKIKPIKPRELTEIEKDLLIIKNATNGMSSDSEGSRLSSVDEKNPKALKRKRVSFSTEDVFGNAKKVKLSDDSESALVE